MSALFVLEVLAANALTRALAIAGALWLVTRPFARFADALLAAAAGFLCAMSLTHLLPEAFEAGDADPHELGLVMFAVMALFLASGRLLRGLHGHGQGGCGCACGSERDDAAGPAALFFAGALHSFVDGILIAAAFLASREAGWFAAFAVIAHEIPQQTGYLVILRTAGRTRAEALRFCAGVAAAAVLGAAAGLAAVGAFAELLPYALAMSAASFLYITLFMLIPEVFEGVESFRGNLARLIWIALGAGLSFALLGFMHGDGDGGHGHGHVHVYVHAEPEAHDHDHDRDEHEHERDHVHGPDEAHAGHPHEGGAAPAGAR